MTDILDMDFLPEKTRKIYQHLGTSSFISNFTLVGGTALAMQIKHRLSEDLDFVFDGDELNINQIKRNIKNLFPSFRIIRQDHKWQIDFAIDEVKLTFFSTGAIALPFEVRTYSFRDNNVNIAEAKAIAALKFSAIAQRNTIRDYYDLYYLSRYHFPLLELINFTREVNPNLSPITYTETLVYTKDIAEDNISSHLSPAEKVNKEQMAAFFSQELIKIQELI
jgi:predicted nucleotidyltransferase component of viral defense system